MSTCTTLSSDLRRVRGPEWRRFNEEYPNLGALFLRLLFRVHAIELHLENPHAGDLSAVRELLLDSLKGEMA